MNSKKEMRRGIRTEEGRKMAEKKFQLDEIEADLDNDGKLSEYEKTRGEAIQTAMADDEPVNMMCGGLMADDHDMMVGMDPVSGNMVPPGSNEENVRDDIPAALSDGEYVVPADVVRYHGLKTFMGLREEAKLGLMAMAMEGQIQTIEEEDLDEEYEEEETHTMPDGTEMPGATHDEYDEDYSEEEEDYMEEGEEYETPEDNVVEIVTTETEEEFISPEEEEDEYSSDGKNTYRPSIKFALMK